MREVCLLSAHGEFFLPLSREFILWRERFGLWKVYAPFLSSLFFVFYCNDDIWKLFTQEHALLH